MRASFPIAIVITLSLFPSVSGRAAFEFIPMGARPTGLAGAFVAVADDANSPVMNPAGMSQLGHPELTSFYTVLYGLDGLTRTMCAAVIPTPVGGVGVSYEGFGGEGYRETVMGMSASRALVSRLMIGVTGRTLILSIDGYGTARATAIDAGLLVRLPGAVRIGLVARNVNRARLAGSRDQVPRPLCIGMSRAGPHVVVTAQVDREPGQPVCGRIGQEFRFAPFLVVRSGILTDPSMFFAGASVMLPRVETSYAVSSHPVLGLTHQVSLSVMFGRQRRR
ncbi:MAG: hypothetical protein HY710_15460 [Candidatus Latescibacteria bacterium]|nr:hypothetical protein [Candidatus Latescibacterota bacterium]